MQIEEIIRTCSNADVACAAVASIGLDFSTEIASAAAQYEMNVGRFVVMSVARFSRHGDEGELRSVLSAMNTVQEPVLAGLHRILCIMLATGRLHGGSGPDRQNRVWLRRSTRWLRMHGASITSSGASMRAATL